MLSPAESANTIKGEPLQDDCDAYARQLTIKGLVMTAKQSPKVSFYGTSGSCDV